VWTFFGQGGKELIIFDFVRTSYMDGLFIQANVIFNKCFCSNDFPEGYCTLYNKLYTVNPQARK